MSSAITISERLDIQDGDVLILRANISHLEFQLFREEFKRFHGDKRVAVVQLREGQDLTKLSPEAMLAAGWVLANEAESGKAGFYHFTREMLADAYVAAEPPEATL
jgi:hypothetical protein